MCGILGCLAPDGLVGISPVDRVRDALPLLAHRGPDDRGVWADAGGMLALGHTRLAILDPTAAGRQPMVSDNGRFVLVFNGEIYNHLALRKDLPTRDWRGHSDTETLLACCSAWGVARTLQAARGMFAMALLDRSAGTLLLARDRMGEKPLYYSVRDGMVTFASELHVVTALLGSKPPVDRQSLAQFMQRAAVPAPATIYEGVCKLRPGTTVTINLANREAVTGDYWSLAEVIETARADPITDSKTALTQLDDLLTEVVGEQMIADVPLGAFLSGGIDSSIVTMYMRRHGPVQTFTVGFGDATYNEAGYAAQVAERLGTDHTTIQVSGENALAVVPRLPQMYSEPFADSSQVATYLVAAAARSGVTVALSGDGGDELFGGYNRHVLAASVLGRQLHWPEALRSAGAGLLRGLGDSLLMNGETQLRRFDAIHRRLPTNLPDKVRKVADVLSAADLAAAYRLLSTHWHDIEALLPGVTVPGEEAIPAGLSDPEWMMMRDALGFLPDDVLTKVDRATMATSLESRAPLLDPRLVSFAWRCALPLKIRDGKGKWLLRQLLYPVLGEELVDRPKMGFAIPLDSWLRGPLRDWGEALLTRQRLLDSGLAPDVVLEKWQQHQSGRANCQDDLWHVLMYQAWREAEV